MAISKKKIIKSLENLSGDLLELIHQQYPSGYQASISRITNAKKEPIFVFPLETDGAIYLIKLPATKNSDGEYDVEPAEKEEFTPPKGERAAPGDEFDNAEENFDGENEEENADSDDYDEERSNKRGREASYDPDFDG